MYNSVQEKYRVKKTKYGSILSTFPLWFHICFTCNGLMILTIIYKIINRGGIIRLYLVPFVFTVILIDVSLIMTDVAVSFICGGNRSPRRKKPQCCRQVIDKLYYIELHLHSVHLVGGKSNYNCMLIINTDYRYKSMRCS